MQPGEALQEIIKAIEAVLNEGELNSQQLTFVQAVYENSKRLFPSYTNFPALESALRHILPKSAQEFQTPLIAIRGYAEMLADHPQQFGGELKPKQAEAMRFVSRQAQSLANWYQKIVDGANEEIKTQYKATPKPCQLSHILHHCEAVLRFHLDNSKCPVQLSVINPENLPPVIAAAYHLSHLIEHIVNVMAFELIEYGKIQISAAQEDKFVNLRIFCTGIRLSPAEIESLFEKNGRKIYRQRFEQQGGRIEFSREAGMGAAVHLLISIAEN